MQVIFIHHSCFLVEVDDKVLIFDYFGGDKVDGFHFRGKIPEYEPDTKIYMFVSHGHLDHFDPEILTWAEKYPNIKYIISRDIRIRSVIREQRLPSSVMNHIVPVVQSKHYKVDDLEITTFRSTDLGTAFYVETNGVTLFHSGDLHDWVYEGIGELMNGKVTRLYHNEIKKLAGKPLNVAFVPLDPRLGSKMFLGIEFFLQNTDAEYIFPMHMWQNYEPIRQLKKRITNRSMVERIIEIERENQVFLFGEE